MKRRTEEDAMIKSLTKFWFHSSGKLARMSTGNLFFGIFMALEDIAEWITEEVNRRLDKFPIL